MRKTLIVDSRNLNLMLKPLVKWAGGKKRLLDRVWVLK